MLSHMFPASVFREELPVPQSSLEWKAVGSTEHISLQVLPDYMHEGRLGRHYNCNSKADEPLQLLWPLIGALVYRTARVCSTGADMPGYICLCCSQSS